MLDTTTGRTLASVRADTPRIPASVEKLYTTSTALLRFGPSATLQTRVLGVGTLDDAGTWHGDLYLRGGGDPTFGSDAFDRLAYGLGTTASALAARVRAAGILRVTGRVRGDESWLDRLRGGPATGYALDLDIGGPLGGLLFNRGLAREDGSALQTQPAKFAAQQLTLELRRARVRVPQGAATGTAAATTREEIATVDSPTMATLVRLTLVPSDNLFAEMLLKGHRRALRQRRLDRRRASPSSSARSAASASARGSPTAPASRASTAPRRRQVVTLLRAMQPARRAARRAAGRRPLRHARQPHAQHDRAGPLPGEDRHALERLRARRLLPHAQRPRARVRVHRERRLHADREGRRGPPLDRARTLAARRGRPADAGAGTRDRRRRLAAGGGLVGIGETRASGWRMGDQAG